ncbi:4-alpha-glucanotransferase DPE2 [Physcomitrium patens]|uniref:4-alpha-glucanotransferase n=1 Tax=Physcomitrium patens TaxID=3218 RepID=A0A2K1JEK9_PHYPA|nr:4-alpha-glucanotransferase DPE2-like [Physcomitrium patens]PNR39949.1 hypothetical protein PHYPA_020229 [Physcomitrium patens]|eukprot:XP_024395916.1 4-alpha-glucanotransferase DPE2-like [Physcomitrella patens]
MGSGGDLGGRTNSLRRLKRLNILFKLPYNTQWGQNLMIIGSDALLGAWVVEKGQRLMPRQEGDVLVWEVSISVSERFETEYNYVVVDDRFRGLRRESGARRVLSLPEGLSNGATVEVHDLWQDSPETLFTKEAYRKVLFGDEACKSTHIEGELSKDPTQCFTNVPLNPSEAVVVQFKIANSVLHPDQAVFVIGSSSELGQWNNEAAIALSNTVGYSWECLVSISRTEFPVSYKYILKNSSGVVTYENDENRVLSLSLSAKKSSSVLIAADGSFRSKPWRGAGVAIPVFAIRSTESVGAGEFLDLKLMVDMAVKTGMRLVQLLPVNDTSVNMMWWDSYPYSSLSVFALHPLYLRLQALSNKLPNDIKEDIENYRKQLDMKEVDYEATLAAKLSIAKRVYNLEKDLVFNSALFKKYFDENKGWLQPYAAFCFLRNLFGTSDHSQWGLYGDFTQEKLDKLVSPMGDYYDAVAFSYYLQFHLHSQLAEVRDYAMKKHVVLKGDLPIGVDRNSVDTWQFPSLFRMTASTGAPPDYFDMNGQNWGFPTYVWEEMAKDNYGWWRARLSQMAKYFSAYRIDHVLGFFRIWEMPDHAVTGLMGRFRPSIPLSTEELEREGIWDFQRLSTPYVRCHILQGKFGDRWTEVAENYFDEFEHLCYQFKEEYNTEKKIISATTLKDNASSFAIQEAEADRTRLFDLLHEVILMRDRDDPSKFYPRFGMDKTVSFDELDDHSKNVLKSKYNDYFFHRQEQLWRDNALMTLPALLNSSDMLCCGEDLGMVPACVQPVLSELGLLGLRIQRMPSAPGQEFGNPADYEYMTVCAPSCHDSSTMRAWWEEDEGRRERFFRNMLGLTDPPPETCDPHVSHLILQQHLESPSMWAIFPLQDLMALKDEYAKRPANEETINDPTNPRHYWRFRVHIPMETLLCDDDFVGIIRDLVVSSGRATSKDFDLSSSSIVPAVRDHELKHVNKTVSGKRLDDNKIIIDRTYSGEGLDVAKPVVATSYFNTIVTA